MARLTVFLLLVVCIHASLAGFGGRKRWGGSRWVKSGLKKLGVHAPWGTSHDSLNGDKKIWERDESEEGHEDFRKMRDEDKSSMMLMRMKKMLKPLRDLFVKVLGLGSKETVTGRPAFCGDNECPSFKLLNKSEHYELRMYQPSQWVSTSMQAGKTMSRAQSKSCFWRLFGYIQGSNDREQKIKMTVPVTRVYKRVPTTEKINITMSFYLPPSITNPPSPNDQKVWVKNKGSFKVYVHSFDGYAKSQSTWMKHVKMLQRMLDRDGLSGKYHSLEEMYVTAGYDDPMKLFNRHNEVWLVAKDQEA